MTQRSYPQSSWLCPLSFLVLIDDLDVNCLIHKYVDDTTLSEVILTPHQPSNMQHYFQQLLAWSTANDMDVNFDKTKEMVFGHPSLVISGRYLTPFLFTLNV